MQHPPSPPPPGPPSHAAWQWSSTQLLAGRREVRIEHHGAVYVLRVTAAGKLILTK